MRIYKDNYICSDENAFFRLALFSTIGGRTDQQDSAGYELKNTEGIVAVCDGMGGHEGGKIASTIAVDTLIKGFGDSYPSPDIHELLLNLVEKIDLQISSLRRDDGFLMKGGTTAAAIIIREEKLFWVSVGDSRIYISRDDELVQVTSDHVYQNKLDRQLAAGQISRDEYESRSKAGGEALISFLGAGGLTEIDANESPFLLRPNDRILLTTDGLFKLVPNEDIVRILSNFSNIDDALRVLEMKAQKYGKNRRISRDNMTVALIKIK